MCPMAHLINITAAVLLGPVDAFLVALLIGIIRMCVMGIPPLALTGAVFGALLSGILYKVTKGKIWAAVLGEIVGTGIIGAIVSYPVMTYICGREGHLRKRRPRMVFLRAVFYVRHPDRRKHRGNPFVQAPACRSA